MDAGARGRTHLRILSRKGSGFDSRRSHPPISAQRRVPGGRTLRSRFDFRLPFLALGGLLAGAVLAELVLRAVGSTADSVEQPDPVLLQRLIPGGRKIVVRPPEDGGNWIRIRVNQHGFRGPELRPRVGQKRVVVYGDSFIEAEASALNATFPRQLEQQLARLTGADIEVINAGVRAYGPDQISLRVAQEMESLAPDLVVVGIFAGNDFGDLVRDKIYRLGAQGELVRNDYHLSPTLEARMRRLAQPRGLQRLHLVRLGYRVWRVLHPSPGANRWAEDPANVGLVDRWLQLDRDEYRDFVERGDNEVKNLTTDHLNVDVAVDPDSPSARFKIALMEQTLREIRQTVEAHGARFVLLIIPSPFDVVVGYPIVLDSARYPRYRRSRLTDVVEQIARRNAMTYVNLYAPFQAAGPESLFFHVGNSHWNDAGERLAAELTARLIRDSSLLTAAPGRGLLGTHP